MSLPNAPSPNTLTTHIPTAAATVVKIADVARLAGVSPSTVSRILNGTAKVAAHKEDAVRHAIATLGYVPNPIARGLASGRSMSVGVITQAIDSPFYGASLRGIEDVLSAQGVSPLFVSGHWDEAQERRCLDALRNRRVDGIIVLTGRLPDADLINCARSTPVVVTGRVLLAPQLQAFDFDNYGGAKLATMHLIGLGHRRIAFLAGPETFPDTHQRYLGYQAALLEAGITFDPRLVVAGTLHEASGLAAIEQLLDQNIAFSAVFAANDQMAVGAAFGLHQRGLRIPQDVSLVGFDDLPASMFCTPALTTVHQPAYEMGQIAAEAMLGLLRGSSIALQVPPPQLILRQSTSTFTRR